MTNEKEIREEIKKHFREKIDNIIIKEEYTHSSLDVRNDLLIIDEDKKEVYSIEIKSNGDTLKRLDSQISGYKLYSHYVIVVIDKKHLLEYQNKYKDKATFNKVGLMIYDERTLYTRYKYYKFKNILHLPLLWSNEVQLFFSNLKYRSKVPKDIDGAIDIIHELFTYREIQRISYSIFANRIKLLQKQKIVKLDFVSEEIQNIINKKQEVFTKYIKGEYERN